MHNIVKSLLQIQNQLRIFHWQTKSYAAHKALGKAYEALDDLVDTFVETALGKGETDFTGEIDIKLYDIGSVNLNDVIDTFKILLLDLNTILNLEVDSDLLNIRDEMLGSLNQLSYLLKLK